MRIAADDACDSIVKPRGWPRDDDNDKALALVDDGLASAPKDLQLLELQGNSASQDARLSKVR